MLASTGSHGIGVDLIVPVTVISLKQLLIVESTLDVCCVTTLDSNILRSSMLTLKLMISKFKRMNLQDDTANFWMMSHLDFNFNRSFYSDEVCMSTIGPVSCFKWR